MGNRNILMIIVSFYCVIADAQYKLSGYVTDTNGKPVKDASVVLLGEDSLSTVISGTITNEKGYFSFSQLKKDTYLLSLTYIGNKPVIEKIYLDSDKEIQLSMETTVELDEFIVTSDRSNITTMTSAGSSFYLSSKAKESKDIYDALQEIPKLSIDKNVRSVTLADGSNPLILINGIRRDGGIGSINPGDIESVEIIESPSIRYSKEGYTGIINLKVKEQKTKYHYLNTGANLNPKFIFGIVDATYETGNENHSFYVNVQEFHFNRNKAFVTDRVKTNETIKEIKTNNESNYFDNYLAIGGDKVWSKSDYSSFSVTFHQIPVSGERDGNGTYESGNDFKTFSHQRIYNDKSLTNTNNLYHKHTFENSSNIEGLLRINTSRNDNKAQQNDKGEYYNFESDIHFKNRRISGSLSLNYNFMAFQQLNMNIGSQTYYQKNTINHLNTELPIFHHREWNEHVFFDFDKTFRKKFSIAGSLGMDMFFIMAEKEKNNYYNLKPSITFGYKPSPNHFFRLSYNKYMQTPAITQLNPYNTSTDTLIISTGNPSLKPQYIHNTQFNYSFTHLNTYLEPYIKYIQYTGSIRYKGEVVDNIYIRKPVNVSNYKVLQTGLRARFTLKNIGYINGNINFKRKFFDDGQIRNSLNGTFSLYAYYKKLSLDLYYYDFGVEYSPISKFVSSPETQLTLIYKINNHWDVQAGIRYLSGNQVIDRWTYDDLYEQYYKNEFLNRGHILLLGFRYNLDKKDTKREQKKLKETDKGFRLINE